jgi:hypothetical protein
MSNKVTAAELAEKERKAQEAEAHRMEQEAANLAFRVEQQKRAAVIGQKLLAEVTGGMAAAYAVGECCWDYYCAELTRGTAGDTARFADATRHIKADIRARMTTDTDPNVSRYVGFVGLAKLWGADKLLQLPKSIAQEALPMITRDDTAPSLEYETDTPRGKETRVAFQWVPGCEVKGPELLQKVIDGQGTCAAMTLSQFTEARKAFCAAGRGRHNQKGTNKGGKGKGGKGGKAAAKAAAGKLAQGIAAIKAYAGAADVPANVRMKGLRAVIATVRELATELRASATAPADKGKGGKAAAGKGKGKAAA